MKLTDLIKGVAAALRSLPRPPAPEGDTYTPRPSKLARRGVGITEYDLRAFGPPKLAYSPRADGAPDPGEVVWGWVPYEDDATQGKDRPILIVGSGAGALVGLQLTSRDRAIDGSPLREAGGRVWFDVGTGRWDPKGRPSEARLDRLLRVEPTAVRREGGALSADRFDDIMIELRAVHGWT